MENVKNLKNHDKGKTLKIVISELEGLGYTTNWRILNAKDFGVPQNRERLLIIGSINGYKFDFDKLNKREPSSIANILEKENEEIEYLEQDEYTIIENYKKQISGIIFIGYRNKNKRVAGTRPNAEHLSRVHMQQNRIYSSEGTLPTLSSQETGGRYFIYHNERVRKLTIGECFKLMGFPDDFKIIGKKASLYNRIGNSVVVPLVEEIAKNIELQFFQKKEILEKNIV